MALKDFFTEIYNFEYEIPVSVKIFIIALILVIITVFFVTSRDNLSTELIKDNYVWLYTVVFINLLNMGIILYYYQYKTNELRKTGEQGPKGNIGMRGERGKFITCSLCDTNIILQKCKRFSLLVNLKNSTMLSERTNPTINQLNEIYQKYDQMGLFFEDLNIESIFKSSGLATCESQIIKTLLINSGDEDMAKLGNSSNTINMEYIIKTGNLYFIMLIHNAAGTLLSQFSELMLSFSLKSITKSLSNGLFEYPGSFYNVAGGKVGFFSMGDTVFNEDSPNRINAYLVNGDVRNPVDFDKQTNFTTLRTGDFNEVFDENYTVWRPRPPTDYISLGDMVQFGRNKPKSNLVACLHKNCLTELEIEDLELAFMYYGYDNKYTYDAIQEIINSGNIETLDKSIKNTKDAAKDAIKGATKSATKNKATKYINDLDNLIDLTQDLNDIYSIYSVWRTPLNTFYINTTNYAVLTNNSVIYNLVEGNPKLLDNYGVVTDEARLFVTNRLKSIKLSKYVRLLIFRAFYISFYQNKLMKKQLEIRRSDYFTKLNNQRELLEEKYRANVISENEFNKKMKEIFIKINKRPVENLINEYLNRLKRIPIDIEAKTNLYDILFTVIPGGFDTQIYIDRDEINTGGIELLSIQTEILKLCKAVIPPKKPAYMIKNECLSFTTIDIKRQRLIRELKKYIDEIKLIEKFARNPKRYCGDNYESIYNYNNMMREFLMKYLAHIPQGPDKLFAYEFDDLPTSRLIVIKDKFKEFSSFIKERCSITIEDFTKTQKK